MRVLCVFFPFILDIMFVGRTSRGHTEGKSHSISHPPSFCGACLNFSREKDSVIHFPSSTVKSNFDVKNPARGHNLVEKHHLEGENVRRTLSKQRENGNNRAQKYSEKAPTSLFSIPLRSG